MTETWRPVPGFEGAYEISDMGRVKSCERTICWEHKHATSGQMCRLFPERIMRLHPQANGYLAVWLRNRTAIHKHYGVHQLVALAFIPNPENKGTVNHINGIKTDNRVSQLEWMTNSEQQLHSCALRQEREENF